MYENFRDQSLQYLVILILYIIELANVPNLASFRPLISRIFPLSVAVLDGMKKT